MCISLPVGTSGEGALVAHCAPVLVILDTVLLEGDPHLHHVQPQPGLCSGSSPLSTDSLLWCCTLLPNSKSLFSGITEINSKSKVTILILLISHNDYHASIHQGVSHSVSVKIKQMCNFSELSWDAQPPTQVSPVQVYNVPMWLSSVLAGVCTF